MPKFPTNTWLPADPYQLRLDYDLDKNVLPVFHVQMLKDGSHWPRLNMMVMPDTIVVSAVTLKADMLFHFGACYNLAVCAFALYQKSEPALKDGSLTPAGFTETIAEWMYTLIDKESKWPRSSTSST